MRSSLKKATKKSFHRNKINNLDSQSKSVLISRHLWKVKGKRATSNTPTRSYVQVEICNIHYPLGPRPRPVTSPTSMGSILSPFLLNRNIAKPSITFFFFFLIISLFIPFDTQKGESFRVILQIETKIYFKYSCRRFCVFNALGRSRSKSDPKKKTMLIAHVFAAKL